MIATAAFSRAHGRVKPLRFTPRAGLPLDLARAIARSIEAALNDVLGDGCELVVGEPAAIAAAAWSDLTRDALLYVRRGRPTDAVLVVPPADARRLVLHAFGEPAAPAEAAAPFSALERQALERIAARCSAAFEPVCGGAPSAGRLVSAEEVPTCCAYVDVRVRQPLAVTLGVGVAADVPEPRAAETLDPRALEDLPLEARAVFAEGILDTADFVRLRPGHVVKLATKVGAPASLNCGPRRLATGVAGVVASRTAFLVRDVVTGAADR